MINKVFWYCLRWVNQIFKLIILGFTPFNTDFININFSRWDRKRREPFKGLEQSDYKLIYYYPFITSSSEKKVIPFLPPKKRSRCLLEIGGPEASSEKSVPEGTSEKSVPEAFSEISVPEASSEKSSPEDSMLHKLKYDLILYFLLWKKKWYRSSHQKSVPDASMKLGGQIPPLKKVFQKPPLKKCSRSFHATTTSEKTKKSVKFELSG